MIDIHTHLLPDVDDGVKTKEESIALLKEYKKAGFTAIVCTPHLHDPFVETKIFNIRDAFAWFEQEAASFGITAYLGSELYIRTIPGKYIPFLGRFQLIETNVDVEPLFLLDRIFDLQMDGLTVILAHIERYSWFSPDSNIANRMREMGVLFQVNVEMLNDRSVQSYLDKDWVDFIASDHHGSRRGAVDFKLWKKYGHIMERSREILGLSAADGNE